MRTNAVRRLEGMGVRHALRAYDVAPADLTAGAVASRVGRPVAQVLKTLLARGDRHGVEGDEPGQPPAGLGHQRADRRGEQRGPRRAT